MSAINFVVRDGAGNISRGSVAGEGVPSSLIVGAGADVSLNLTSGQILSYTRQGQALQITLVDGRVITIEGYFTSQGVAENELFLSSDSHLTAVDLTQGAGADYFANYAQANDVGKYSANDDLYFARGADVQLAEGVVPADDQVGMLGAFAAAPLLGLGGAAAAVGAAALVATGGGDDSSDDSDDGPEGPTVVVTDGTVEAGGDTVNEEEHADGVVIGGTGTPGATVDVTIDDVTETTTIDDNGDFTVTFGPDDIAEGEYETPVDVTVTNGDGSTTITETLVVDTVIGVDITAPGGDDGIINGVEFGDGITLTGAVTGGDAVVVTIGGVDFDATVDGSTWTLDVPTTALGEGEYTDSVTVTATDAAGNSSSTSSSIVVDTVTSVTVNTSAVGGADSVLNDAEHADGVSLTGTAQPGATVVVTLGTVSQTVTATADGTWSATYAAADVPTGELDVPVNVTATDAAGNTASASSTVTVDTFVNELEVTSNSAGGADGVVNFNESGEAITLTGTVEAGSSVSVNLAGVVTAATVDAGGNWSVTFPGGTLDGGEYETEVVVTATDAAGNTSSLSEPVIVDTVAGDLALSSDPIEIDDVVNAVEASDGVIINGTATAGLTVTVGLGDASLTTVAADDGTWTVTFPPSMVPADTDSASITASITDAAGNFKQVSDTVAIDTVVEPHEWSATPVEGDDIINAAEAEDGVVLSGTTEAGSTIVVEFGGESVTVVSGASGAWSANFSAASIAADFEGTAPMTATATDIAGNVSVITDTVEIDTYVNELTSTDPVEGDNIVNSDEAADGVTLGGTVEAGSSVSVTFVAAGATLTQAATVDADGNWSVTYAGADIPGGQYEVDITIVATDANGNTASIADTFTVDTVAPDASNIERVTFNPEGVIGLGVDTPDADVSIHEITSAHDTNDLAVGADGSDFINGELNFGFDTPLPNGSHLVVNETDAAGNTNATFVAIEETGTNAVDLAGLEDFNIGSIDLGFSQDAELTLDLATLQGLSDADNNLIIHGSDIDADSVTLVGADAAATGETASVDGKSFDIYTLGDDSQILIEDGITVTI